MDLSDGQSASFPVQVEYYFGGTYMKKELPVIECGGSITLERYEGISPGHALCA